MHLPPMRHHLAPLLCAIAICGAAPLSDGLVAERVFPEAGACYGRVYDGTHLDRHPGQVVAAMFLSGSSRSLVADRRLADRIDPELALDMRVVFTDGSVSRGGIGCVERDGGIARCGATASCGGDFAVEARPGGVLRIRNDDASGPGTHTSVAVGHGFSPGAGCRPASASGQFVPPDAPNRVFDLRRMPMEACAGRTAR